MKNFRFILPCIVLLFCLFYSCSPEELATEEVPVTVGPSEKEPDDPADKPGPVLPGDGTENPGDGSEKPAEEPDIRVPALVINELRTEFASASSRAEFIEFKMLSAGNLDGLRVFVAGNYRNPLLYEFKPVEVKAGEYVVLHLRTLENTCKDEYGGRLDESGGTDSCPTARDFWIPGSTKWLHKTDAVYVLDKDDQVLDAVMIAENTAALSWDKEYFAEAAEFLFSKGAWKSADGTLPGPADAVDSSGIGTAITRSISRDETAENTRTAADWYITANNGATPGLPNNPKRL